MRLIRLSANHNTFKTVHFNETGVTLIVGEKSKGGETYNGVGKSLIVELLHFCLGSKKNDEFKNKIPAWEFTLEFYLLNQRHSVSRNTSDQNKVYLDHQKMTVPAFTDWMEQRVFTVPEGISGITFRSLLPRFMRRGAKQYVDPRIAGDYGEYDWLIRSAFLLGIDVHLIAKKATIRDEINRIQALRNNFRDDPLLRDFYSGGKDADIHLSHLERQIRKLDQDKQQFVVAEDYYDLQKAADNLATKIEADKNSAFLLRNAISNIDTSLKSQPDLPLERLKSVYGELTANFKPESLKSLDDLSSFHQRLLENRIARLTREKLRLIDKLETIEQSLKPQQVELNRYLRTLGQSRALDQYTAIVNQIGDLTAQAQKLRDYQNIEREYSDKEASLDGQLSTEVIKTNVYLEDTKEFREKNFEVFKDYVARFYPSAVAGISLHNNERNNNKKRFDFDVHIENDSSDGINEVRIFCYDMTLLTLRQGHKIDFIFHDSRLFANMDVRQRAVLFRLVNDVASRMGIQYIASLNPDMITGMESELSSQELKALIKDNIVLELKDDSAQGKLLGIQVNMHYDKS